MKLECSEYTCPWLDTWVQSGQISCLSLRTPGSLPSRHGRRAAQIRGEAGAHRAGKSNIGSRMRRCGCSSGGRRIESLGHDCHARSLSNSQRVVILSMQAHKDAWIKLMCDPNDVFLKSSGSKTGRRGASACPRSVFRRRDSRIVRGFTGWCSDPPTKAAERRTERQTFLQAHSRGVVDGHHLAAFAASLRLRRTAKWGATPNTPGAH